MAKYIGPKTKIARRFGSPIYGANKTSDRHNYPPGQHGQNRKRKKLSEYAIQLNEKQKLKYTYGLLERQFRNLFEKASRMKGRKGDNLLQLLESRLDNVVFRFGIAPTRAAARQLVNHRHIVVNGEVCNIPSALVSPGDVVGVREKSKSLEVVQENCSSKHVTRYGWMEWDNATLSGRFLTRPERESIPEPINEQLIVELYSK
jgi:small subunit ribosomal protein S4